MTLRSIRNCLTSYKNRTISNTTDRTWNHKTVNPAVCLNFLIQFSLTLLTSCTATVTVYNTVGCTAMVTVYSSVSCTATVTVYSTVSCTATITIYSTALLLTSIAWTVSVSTVDIFTQNCGLTDFLYQMSKLWSQSLLGHYCGIADYITNPTVLWIYIGPYINNFIFH